MKVVVAGGGTGGHLFPGIAIAEEFRKRDGAARILFIGTRRGLESRILPGLGYELRTVDIEGIKGRGMRSLAALAKIPGSLVQALKILREFRPEIVIGVGGYASAPAVAAARLSGIRTAVAEQNALPGLTNRLLGRFADRVFLAFRDTGGWFPDSKVIITGNPVRAAFCRENRPGPSAAGGPFTVLVFGGSQGARSINNTMVEAIRYLENTAGLKIIHQTGPADHERIAAAYGPALRAGGLQAEVLPFISDMASAYNAADLLICRAGATSIAEITACGKAAVLIPFPHAVNDHQTKNAQVLAEAGAARLIPERELSGEGLAKVILELCRDREKIAAMETRSRRLGNPDAAARIVDECLRMVNRE